MGMIDPVHFLFVSKDREGQIKSNQIKFIAKAKIHYNTTTIDLDRPARISEINTNTTLQVVI